MNLIIETGACKKWRNNYVSSDKLCRIKLNAQVSYEVVDRQELSSMGDPDTLADFILSSLLKSTEYVTEFVVTISLFKLNSKLSVLKFLDKYSVFYVN